MKHYIVYSKGDDYGACRTELVQTTQKIASQYYHHRIVDEKDVPTLKKYLDFLDSDEEQERDDEQRFYGQ